MVIVLPSLDICTDFKSSAVKTNRGNALFERALCDELANELGSLLVGADAIKVLLVCACTCERYAVHIINDLCGNVSIGTIYSETGICDYENPEALPPISIDEPTMSMLFTINEIGRASCRERV